MRTVFELFKKNPKEKFQEKERKLAELAAEKLHEVSNAPFRIKTEMEKMSRFYVTNSAWLVYDSEADVWRLYMNSNEDDWGQEPLPEYVKTIPFLVGYDAHKVKEILFMQDWLPVGSSAR